MALTVSFAACRIVHTVFALAPVAISLNAQRVTRINESEYRTENLFETWVTPLINAIKTPRFTF